MLSQQRRTVPVLSQGVAVLTPTVSFLAFFESLIRQMDTTPRLTIPTGARRVLDRLAIVERVAGC